MICIAKLWYVRIIHIYICIYLFYNPEVEKYEMFKDISIFVVFVV